jgi:hypothetical protein
MYYYYIDKFLLDDFESNKINVICPNQIEFNPWSKNSVKIDHYQYNKIVENSIDGILNYLNLDKNKYYNFARILYDNISYDCDLKNINTENSHFDYFLIWHRYETLYGRFVNKEEIIHFMNDNFNNLTIVDVKSGKICKAIVKDLDLV